MIDLLNTLVRKVDNQYLIFITIIITLISVIFKKDIQKAIKKITYYIGAKKVQKYLPL